MNIAYSFEWDLQNLVIYSFRRIRKRIISRSWNRRRPQVINKVLYELGSYSNTTKPHGLEAGGKRVQNHLWMVIVCDLSEKFLDNVRTWKHERLDLRLFLCGFCHGAWIRWLISCFDIIFLFCCSCFTSPLRIFFMYIWCQVWIFHFIILLVTSRGLTSGIKVMFKLLTMLDMRFEEEKFDGTSLQIVANEDEDFVAPA